MKETVDIINAAAASNDRWLFVASLVVFGIFAIAVMRYFVRQHDNLIADHKEARDTYQNSLQKIVADQAGTTAKLGEMMDRNISVIEECRDEMRSCRQAREKLRPITALALACMLLFGGCATLDPGADALVVRVEQTQVVAKGAFDLVLRVDHADREGWKLRAPEFHAFCEWLREPQASVGGTNLSRAAYMLWNLEEVKLSYKASRGESNALITALSVVEAAAGQAQGWLAKNGKAEP